MCQEGDTYLDIPNDWTRAGKHYIVAAIQHINTAQDSINTDRFGNDRSRRVVAFAQICHNAPSKLNSMEFSKANISQRARARSEPAFLWADPLAALLSTVHLLSLPNTYSPTHVFSHITIQQHQALNSHGSFQHEPALPDSPKRVSRGETTGTISGVLHHQA